MDPSLRWGDDHVEELRGPSFQRTLESMDVWATESLGLVFAQPPEGSETRNTDGPQYSPSRALALRWGEEEAKG